MINEEHTEHFAQFINLSNAMQLTRSQFVEEVNALEDPDAKELLSKFINMHTAQIDQLMRVIGNVESRLVAVQNAAGIDEVIYPFLDYLVMDRGSPDEQ